MVNSNSTLDDIYHLIGKLRADKKRIEEQVREIDANIEAAKRTLHLLRENSNVTGPASSVIPISAAELVGKSQLQALITIAEKNDGVVSVKDAKHILLDAGIMHNPKTAYQQITAILIKNKRFEWAATGKYRLTTTSQPSLSLTS